MRSERVISVVQDVVYYGLFEFWPYIIPYRITVGNAVAPDASLSFLLYGAVVILPLIAFYTLRVYWIFRDKILEGNG